MNREPNPGVVRASAPLQVGDGARLAPAPTAPWHSLAGKRIWVTGGAGHLGTPIIEALDGAGARGVCIDIDGRAEALVAARGLRSTSAVSLNVCDAEALAGNVAQLIREHGVPDGLVHLAYASSAGKRLTELTAAEFQRTFDLALPATFVLCRSIAEAMKSARAGSIVLFSSMYGVVAPDPRNYPGRMTPNPIDYGASKAAIMQMARYFAAHYGPFGIRFNCVTPGPFSGPAVQRDEPEHIRRIAAKTVLGRIGRNDEIVGPTLFLLTDSASFVTGHSLVVDGGWTAW
jgi:NAD(P)-dependent dehydrogenase (short-subunit alcohol dehydrogenase family)